MSKPLFNFRQINLDPNTKQPIAPKGGSWMSVTSLDRIEPPTEGMLNFVQLCDCGFRMTKETKDESMWNCCTFEDIDYKAYMKNNDDAPDPEIVMGDIVQWLMTNCREITYYYEMSRSGKGFHFVFYFCVKRNMHIRNMCKAISVWAIKKAFYSCGYKDIIEHEKVWDKCTNSLYQACFITKNMSVLHEDCTGDVTELVKRHKYSIENEYNALFMKHNNTTKSSDAHDRDDWEISWSRGDDTDTIDTYLQHQERWRLFNSLSGLCGSDDKKLKEEWEYCASRMIEMNGHDVNYYKEVPYTGDWNELRTGEEYIDCDLLNKFGYEIYFKNKDNDKKDQTKKTKSIRKERVYIQ